MEKRIAPRNESELPVFVEAEGQTWAGTVINYSLEGAMLKLRGLWNGSETVTLRLDPSNSWQGFASEARVVRHSSPDGQGTFLAVRF